MDSGPTLYPGAYLLRVSPASSIPHPTRYGSFDLAIIKLGTDNSSAERQSNPSPDVVLRRVHGVDEGKAKDRLGVLNELLLEHLPLPGNPMIAIDLTTYPYYGEEDPSLVSDSRLPGTDLGIRFAVLSVNENGRTFTLRVKQVGPLESEISILREMLDTAEEFFDPGLVLLDRGFYSVKAIRELKSRKKAFMMPAVRTNPVKKLCRDFESGEIPPKVDYTVEGRTVRRRCD